MSKRRARLRYVRYGSLALALLLGPLSADAQMYKEEKGPGLDPTPIEIPRVVAGARRPITSMDLLSIRDLHGTSISPDGKRIAFIVGQAVRATNRYRSALFVVGTEEGSVPRNLGSAGPPFWKLGGQWFPEPPQWSPDSRTVACRMKKGANWQVWGWKAEGSEPAALTRSPLDVQKFRWSRDGSRIVFEVYLPHDEAAARQIRERGALYDRDFKGPWDINTPVVEQKLAHVEGATQTWIHTIAGGPDRPATAEEVKRDSIWVRGWSDEDIAEAAWSPDHGRLAYNKYLDDPALCSHSCYPLFVRDADGKNEKLLTPGTYFAGNPQWSSDGTRIFFEKNEGDGRGAALAEVSAQGVPVRPLLPATDHLSDCSWDDTKAHAACVVENNVTPPRVAFVDVARRTLRVVADVNPEFRNLALTSGTRIEWKSDDNTHAYLVKPLGYEPGKRYPLIVTTYRSGTGFLRGGVGDEYPIHVFAANGFAVLAFDSGADRNGKPGDFDVALANRAGPLAALKSALQVVDEMGIVDKARVGFTGLSHGSEIGAYSISHSSLFQVASMSGAGTWDLLLESMAPDSMRRWLSQWGLLDANDRPVPERFARLGAASNVERIHTPLLLNVPDNEYLMSLPLYTALRDRHKPVEMWVYPDEYHEKIQPQHRYSVYERNVDWFNFWLRGQEDPDLAKKDQYERWRKLRQLNEEDRKNGAAAQGGA